MSTGIYICDMVCDELGNNPFLTSVIQTIHALAINGPVFALSSRSMIAGQKWDKRPLDSIVAVSFSADAARTRKKIRGKFPEVKIVSVLIDRPHDYVNDKKVKNWLYNDSDAKGS